MNSTCQKMISSSIYKNGSNKDGVVISHATFIENLYEMEQIF